MPEQLTVTFTVAGCPDGSGGLTAVILVADTKVMSWASVPPKKTSRPPPKPAPVIVTVSPPVAAPWLGETIVTAGAEHDDDGDRGDRGDCGDGGVGEEDGGGVTDGTRDDGGGSAHSGGRLSPPEPCVEQADAFPPPLAELTAPGALPAAEPVGASTPPPVAGPTAGCALPLATGPTAGCALPLAAEVIAASFSLQAGTARRMTAVPAMVKAANTKRRTAETNT